MQQRLALGIDLGGTQLRAAVVDCDGAVLSREAIATDVGGGPRQVVEQIRQLYARVCSAEQRPYVVGVGVSAPGPLDSDTGTVLGIPTLPGWQDMPLGAILAEQFCTSRRRRE